MSYVIVVVDIFSKKKNFIEIENKEDAVKQFMDMHWNYSKRCNNYYLVEVNNGKYTEIGCQVNDFKTRIQHIDREVRTSMIKKDLKQKTIEYFKNRVSIALYENNFISEDSLKEILINYYCAIIKDIEHLPTKTQSKLVCEISTITGYSFNAIMSKIRDLRECEENDN